MNELDKIPDAPVIEIPTIVFSNKDYMVSTSWKIQEQLYILAKSGYIFNYNPFLKKNNWIHEDVEFSHYIESDPLNRFFLLCNLDPAFTLIPLSENMPKDSKEYFYGHQDIVNSLNIFKNSQIISTSNDETIYLWDIEKYTQIMNFTGVGGTTGTAHVHKNWDNMFITGNETGIVTLYDVRSKDPIKTIQAHSLTVSCISTEKSGVIYTTGSDDGSIKVWDTRKNELLYYHLKDNRDPISTLKMSDSGKLIIYAVFSTGAPIVLLNTFSGEKVFEIPVGKKLVTSIALSPMGDAIGVTNYGPDVHIYV